MGSNTIPNWNDSRLHVVSPTLLAVIGLLLGGCSKVRGAESTPKIEPVHSISLTVTMVYIYGSANHGYRVSSATGDIVFPPVVGRIFSPPERDISPEFVMAAIGQFQTVELADWEASFDAVASTLRQSPDTAAMQVSPPEARIARVGTFPADLAGSRMLGGGAFVDPRTQGLLILVYTDRPVSITGHRVESSAHFDIDLPTRGFHWVRSSSTPDEPDRFHRTTVDGDVVFGVVISDSFV